MAQEQILKEKQVSGRVQIQVWYRDDTNELVVNLLAADDLALRDEGIVFKYQLYLIILILKLKIYSIRLRLSTRSICKN